MATNNAINTSLSGQSGTGSFAGTTSPTFTTPVLGTPTSGTLTNCTGLPVGGLTGLGTGVGTALGQAVTGSGGIVLATSATMTTPTIGAATATSITFSNPATGGILGTTTNNSASTGYVGEYVASSVSGSTSFTTTATPQNMVSISLTAGDWDVRGWFIITNGSVPTGASTGSISTTSATQASLGLGYWSSNNSSSSLQMSTHVINRISLSGTSTVYLVGQSGWTGGTAATFNAQIAARRVR